MFFYRVEGIERDTTHKERHRGIEYTKEERKKILFLNIMSRYRGL